jgi:dihydrofolate reductase
MRKVKLYIAASLNGKIARANGDVDWLETIPNPDGLDYGYHDFYESIDTTIQGYSTYAQVMGWGIDFPYADKENFVFTRKQDLSKTDHVEFISSDHVNFVKKLKEQEGKDIWLVGGAQLNTMFLNEGLVDEILLYTMPIVLPDGIELFGAIPKETKLQLIESRSFPNGVLESRYEVT